MKKKYIKDTYLKGVSEYDMNIIKDETLNCYISVKHLKKVDKKYIAMHLEKNKCLMDNGHYIIEYIPIDKKYLVRVFMDPNKQVLEYYIDIIKNIGFDEENLYYNDLYLDITLDLSQTTKTRVWDRAELLQAFKNGNIEAFEYNMANETLDKLLHEIDKSSNIYINQNHKEILKRVFQRNEEV